MGTIRKRLNNKENINLVLCAIKNCQLVVGVVILVLNVSIRSRWNRLWVIFYSITINQSVEMSLT